MTDEGAGIPAAARARIFDPFFTTKAQGLGLGLAICHQVLEQHRGAIQVDSTEGRGTSRHVFPADRPMTAWADRQRAS